MPAPVKWTPDFELINAETPEGEPWLAASPDGRFNLTFFESFPTASPAYTDIETRLYSAAGLDTGLGPAPTFSATTTDHQGAVAYFPDGRNVYVWTEEPPAGGGNVEDVYASLYVGQLVSTPRFLVAGGAGIQHDPVVAAGAAGFAVALADDSVAGGQLILKFYNAVGGLIATVTDTDDPEGVNTPPGTEDDYRDVEITALANGNYVVAWTDNVNFDIWARIYSSNGVAQTGVIEIEPGGGNATFPDVTALAGGRFLVTYEQYALNTARGRIYEANGTPSVGPFTITTVAGNGTNQQVQSAALLDGRFVTVWRTIGGNIEGKVMFADGTADGAAFAVNSDGAGNKGRPTVATLADGRFAVSWESGSGATATIFTTIFDPREEGVNLGGTGGGDDFVGSEFADLISTGAGNDRIRSGAGDDQLYGGQGTDAMTGGLGNDRYYVDSTLDTTDDVTGGGGIGDYVFSTSSFTAAAGIERLYLTGTSSINATGRAGQNDILIGNNGNNIMNGLTGNDVMRGGLGNDTYHVDSTLDTTDETTGGGGSGDYVYSSVSFTAAAGIERLYLTGAAVINGTGRDGQNDIITGNSAANTLLGLTGNDVLIGGLGNDTLNGADGLDIFRFDTAPNGATNRDTITGFTALDDTIQLENAIFAALIVTGTLAAGAFNTGTEAAQADDRIIYNVATGALLYDTDGLGGTAGIQFATLTGAPAISAVDFVVF